MATPDRIVGTVTGLLIVRLHRERDLYRPHLHKGREFVFNSQFIGSPFLVQYIPAEMDRLTNDAIRLVQRWEYAAKKSAEGESKIIRPPGYQA